MLTVSCWVWPIQSFISAVLTQTQALVVDNTSDDMFTASQLWKAPEHLSFDQCYPSLRTAGCLTHPTISTRFEDIFHFCDNLLTTERKSL